MNSLKNQLIQATCTISIEARLQKIAAVTTLLYLLTSCASVPYTGRRQFNYVPRGELNALALKVYNEILSKEPEVTDTRLNRINKNVAEKIIAVAERLDSPNYDWKVHLIDNKEPNAVCLPGGKIIVFKGILPYAKTEAGLAAIIAHEVAHAVARHGGERISQQKALRGILSIGGEVLRKNDGTLDTKTRVLLGALGLGGTFGVILPYSRVHELEADKIGQIYMAAAGYDPQEAIRLWERMATRIKKPPVPEWLSTHPASGERVRKLKESLIDAKKYYDDAKIKYGRGHKIGKTTQDGTTTALSLMFIPQIGEFQWSMILRKFDPLLQLSCLKR